MNSSAHEMDTAEQAAQPERAAARAAARVSLRSNHMNRDFHSRTQNQLLASLPAGDWRLIEPRLDWVELPSGAMLHEAGVVPQHVYFPVTAIVSLVSSMRDGSSAEVAMVGNEGFVGLCAFMGDGRAVSNAVVQSAGQAFRMTAESIARHAWQSESVMQQLLLYTHALLTHMAQASACNRHHALDQKLCRWLLLNLDRRIGEEIIVTHEQLAGMLGVRREGVTGSALKLQRAGLIQCRRGHMFVLDRTGLEARSCECYSVIRQAYERLWAGAAMQAHRWRDARRYQSSGAGLLAANA
jgi:CRP-like cAMP-binding protein